jgi:ketosteroid isomerase-like protein
VRQVYARLADPARGTTRTELRDVLASDEHAVALMTVHSERAGKQLTHDTVAVYRIRNGKIAEVWSYSADQYALDEFWS